MTKPIRTTHLEDLDIVDMIELDPLLRQAFAWDVQDATLLGGEHALAVLVQAMGSQAPRIDAPQLTALSKVMHEHAEHVTALEQAAYRKPGLQTII